MFEEEWIVLDGILVMIVVFNVCVDGGGYIMMVC